MDETTQGEYTGREEERDNPAGGHPGQGQEEDPPLEMKDRGQESSRGARKEQWSSRVLRVIQADRAFQKSSWLRIILEATM